MALRLDFVPVKCYGEEILAGAEVFEETRRGVHVDDDDLGTAVAIHVADGESAGRAGRFEGGTGSLCDVFESAVAEVPVHEGLLQIAISDGRAIDFGIDVAVGDDEVFPAIVVEIDKSDSPAEEMIGGEAGALRDVLEELAVLVFEERRDVAGEIGFGDIEEAVAVVVGDGHSHTRLQLAVEVVGDAGGDGGLLEGAIVAVVI